MNTKPLLKLTCAAAVALGMFTANEAQAIQLNFSSLGAGDGGVAAQLAFDGDADSFVFDPSTGTGPNGGFTFGVTSILDGAGDSANLTGNIGGLFTIDTSSIFTFGSTQLANVDGLGTFSIFDGFNTLSADVFFTDISTTGVSGGINFSGSLNLSNISYGGSVQDLLDLSSQPDPRVTVSFTFSSPTNIDALTADGSTNVTSFSGAASTVVPAVPDAGSTMALLGFGLAGIEGLRRRLAARKA
ncbi:MAG: VPDSG-CTERM sorting domain-containing protein [Verrucomicrobiota bacterium]